MNIANKTILITGANRGIGWALVNEALKRGAKKVYAGTRGSLQVPDERVTPITLDVTSDSEIQRAADRVDTLDVLINDAGISLQDDLSNPSMIHQHLAVNCFGLVNVTRAFSPLLTQSKGAVVNILSLASIASVPFSPAYAISKAAALSATQSLRMLLARKGVTVQAVFPGPVDTDMTRDLALPKASAESVAVAIFDGLQNGMRTFSPIPCRSPLRKRGAQALSRLSSASSGHSCRKMQRIWVELDEEIHMCLACIASAAVMVAGAGSGGGILVVCIRKFRKFFEANRLGQFQKTEEK
jgi:NAD(P)-dependent dehydrogenase (short-subunit alcohol dehydrogenase family)